MGSCVGLGRDCGWLAKSALMAATSIGLVLCANGAALAQQTQTYQLNIRSQDLGSSLMTLADKTGLRLLVAFSTVAGKSSPEITGSFTRDEALSRMLAGTSLGYAISDDDTVTIIDRIQTAQIRPRTDANGEVVELNEVVVDGDTADDPYRTPGSSNHISREDLERFGTTTIGNIFRGTPGVLNRDNNNSASLDVNVRGMQGMNRVPVKIDGSMQALGTYRGYLGVDTRSYIDPAFIGGVDITKGPDGGANGAGATGGVVNMRTVNADDIIKDGKSWGVKVRGGIISHTVSPPPVFTQQKRTDIPSLLDINSGQGSIIGAYKNDSFEFVAGLAKTRQGNYFAGKNGRRTVTEENVNIGPVEEPISKVPPGDEILNSQRDTLSGLLKAKAIFGDGHQAALTYVYFDSAFGEIMPSEVTRYSWDTVRQWEPNEVTSHRLVGNYGWKPTDNDLIDLRINAWGTWLDSYNRTTTGAPGDPNYPLDFYKRVPSETAIYGGDISNTSRFDTSFGEATVVVGGSYSHEDTDPLQKTFNWMPPDGTRSETSAFVQGGLKINEWLRFDGGLRYTAFQTHDRGKRNYYNYKGFYGIDAVELDGTGISPNISATVEAFAGVQLFAKYSEGFRGPSLIESTENFNRPPNPLLKGEEARNWEFGVNVLRDSFISEGDKLRFKATHFRNDVHNYIGRSDFQDDGFFAPNRAYNMGAAKFEGYEASIDYDAGRWFTNLSGTYYSRIAFCDAYRKALIDPGGGMSPYYTTLRDRGCFEHSAAADYSGNTLPPRYSASATLGFRFLEEKLTVGGRLTYIGERASQGAAYQESSTMPVMRWRPYTLVDAFASYKVNDTFTVDFSGENLTNEYYIDALSMAATPAPGRTFRVNMTAQF